MLQHKSGAGHIARVMTAPIGKAAKNPGNLNMIHASTHRLYLLLTLACSLCFAAWPVRSAMLAPGANPPTGGDAELSGIRMNCEVCGDGGASRLALGQFVSLDYQRPESKTVTLGEPEADQ